MTACVAAGRRSTADRKLTVPITISSGRSLLAAGPPICDGIFLYRGVSYHVEIEGCREGYAGSGTVQGLKLKESIAGDYSVQPGTNLWRNPAGVIIGLSPPLQTTGNNGPLEVDYEGPALPRQPWP